VILNILSRVYNLLSLAPYCWSLPIPNQTFPLPWFPGYHIRVL